MRRIRQVLSSGTINGGKICTICLLSSILVTVLALVKNYKMTVSSESDGENDVSYSPITEQVLGDKWLDLLLQTSTKTSTNNVMRNVSITVGNTTKSVSRPIVLVSLSGSTGNNIGKIAHGLCMALWIYRDYKVMPKLVMRHQLHDKWVKASEEVHQCFPNLRGFDFALGNNNEFSQMINEQKMTVEPQLRGISYTGNEAAIKEALHLYMKLWTRYWYETESIKSNSSAMSLMPLLVTDRIAMYDCLTDNFYHQIRRFFQFDKKACCAAELPGPNDRVFHLRGFLEELKERAEKLGFEELGPKDVATRVFSRVNKSESIVFVTPQQSSRNKIYIEYVEVLKSTHNLPVRTSPMNNTAMNDFCYIMKAKKEAVGYTRSTFFGWATLLGDVFDDAHQFDADKSCKVRSYSVDSEHRRTFAEERKGFRVYTNYNWRYALELKDRYCFEL